MTTSLQRSLCRTSVLGALVLIVAMTTLGGRPAGGADPHAGSPPTITGLNPSGGYSLALTPVTITGTNFTGVDAVEFGTTPGTNLVVGSPTTITVTSPPLTAGSVNVTVISPAGASAPVPYTYSDPVPVSEEFPGYWLVGSDGGVFSFGFAGFFGSTGSLALQRPVVGIAPGPFEAAPEGYWLVASDGGIFSFGSSQFYGSLPGLGLHPAGSGLPHSLSAPIVGMVPTDGGDGYLLVGADGGVFAFGDARFEGSCPGVGGCVGSAVAVVPDDFNNGYWVVTNSGQVYAFGGATYYGAPENLGSPVTSAVSSLDGGGYYILLANGTVLPYGNAVNFGSPPAGTFGGSNPATAIFTNPEQGTVGYGVVSANGTVDTFGFVKNSGGMSGSKLNGSIISAVGFG